MIKTSETVEVADKELLVIENNDQRVLTTQQVADGYGCTTNAIRKALQQNKGRFTKGKHYYELNGDELKEFKRLVLDKHQPLVDQFAPKLYLWTERGCALLSKIIDTDRAWEFQEALVDNYFKQRPKSQAELIAMMAQQAVEQEHRLKQVETEQEQIRRDMESLRREVTNVDSTLVIDGVGSVNFDVKQWVKSAKKAFPDSDYSDIYNYLYETIEQVGRVKLNIRLENKKKRMREQGASESDVNSLTKLSVIDDSRALREICRLQMARIRQRYKF